jgi:hypothetical protein
MFKEFLLAITPGGHGFAEWLAQLLKKGLLLVRFCGLRELPWSKSLFTAGSFADWPAILTCHETAPRDGGWKKDF